MKRLLSLPFLLLLLAAASPSPARSVHSPGKPDCSSPETVASLDLAQPPIHTELVAHFGKAWLHGLNSKDIPGVEFSHTAKGLMVKGYDIVISGGGRALVHSAVRPQRIPPLSDGNDPPLDLIHPTGAAFLRQIIGKLLLPMVCQQGKRCLVAKKPVFIPSVRIFSTMLCHILSMESIPKTYRCFSSTCFVISQSESHDCFLSLFSS